MGKQTSSLTLNEFQTMAARTANKDLERIEELKNYAMGLVGEAAECSEHIKKNAYHGHVLNRDGLKEELGDVLFYAANLARVLGYTLEEIALHNNEKLLKRYPQGFDKGHSVNRTI